MHILLCCHNAEYLSVNFNKFCSPSLRYAFSIDYREVVHIFLALIPPTHHQYSVQYMNMFSACSVHVQCTVMGGRQELADPGRSNFHFPTCKVSVTLPTQVTISVPISADVSVRYRYIGIDRYRSKSVSGDNGRTLHNKGQVCYPP